LFLYFWDRVCHWTWSSRFWSKWEVTLFIFGFL
jgi:hypothetical protein